MSGTLERFKNANRETDKNLGFAADARKRILGRMSSESPCPGGSSRKILIDNGFHDKVGRALKKAASRWSVLGLMAVFYAAVLPLMFILSVVEIYVFPGSKALHYARSVVIVAMYVPVVLLVCVGIPMFIFTLVRARFKRELAHPQMAGSPEKTEEASGSVGAKRAGGGPG